MKLITTALRYPVTVAAAIAGIVLFAYIAVKNAKIDIFPKLGLPTVYVAQPYGGLSPEQMEGFVTSYYEYHFLYITGVKYVESKSIQGAALIKIEFNEGTDMSQAMAEVVGYVNRSRAFMPPGTVPPFITRFDAGSVSVGQLVFSSDTRSLGEISDLALFRVRPMFSTLPGVSAPPPFGGNQKTVLITVDPDKIRSYGMSPEQVVQAMVKSNVISPAGNLRMGDTTYITPQNSVIESLQDLQNTPLQLNAGPAVYIRDIATVSLGSDVTTSYALINGKRSVYIPVTKRADASTWDVVKRVKAALPDMQAAIPDDIKVSYEFDQSGFVTSALKNVLFEGGIGAILTGLMVLLFLRDARSALIVLLTIPLSLLTAQICLYFFGQTINIMTLGGLALSIGILVDESTVTIENIHRHLEEGKSPARAIADACNEIAGPKLLILLSILSVFIPALFMSGVPRAMFMPLSLAVGFAMIGSFFLSQTFVPVLANKLLRKTTSDTHASGFTRLQKRYISFLERKTSGAKFGAAVFLVICIAATALLFRTAGTSLFPAAERGQTQIRLRLPTGTRLERTEDATRQLLSLVNQTAGQENVVISSAFVGTQPSSFPVNLIHLWTAGPNEAVMRVNFKPGTVRLSEWQETMRSRVKKEMPGASLSFEPGDLAEQVLNLGATNPVEIAVVNKNLDDGKKTASQLVQQLRDINMLRDVQIITPTDYPAIKLDIDRVKAGQLGLTTEQITRATVAATSSSRFTSPGYWLDKSTGTAYIVQVQYPEYKMNSPEQLEMVPIVAANGTQHVLSEVASWKRITMPGEYDRINQQRSILITANVAGKDLGGAFKKIRSTIANINVPKGGKILLRGQSDLLNATMDDLQGGLLIAIAVICLLMAIFFQSFTNAFMILSVIPAVTTGSLLLLILTGNTLNIQSYTGCIMAIGVAIANVVLYMTQAERLRKHSDSKAYSNAASGRLRPILMTNAAMIAGMLPMAIGFGESGASTAPLGIAVIGGLLFSMISVLFFMPFLYNTVLGKKAYVSPSLDPDDENGTHFNEQ